MKTLVCVDLEGGYCAALTLYMRLGFSRQHLIFAHAIQTTGLIAGGVAHNELIAGRVLESLYAAGQTAVKKASATYPEIPSKVEVLTGNASSELLKFANAQRTDLICLGSSGKRGLASYFGSLSRAMAMGAKQSLLIGKDEPAPTGPLTAIFATDHSSYANRCLKKLCRWKPAGIEAVHVVTAFDLGSRRVEQLLARTAVEVDLKKAMTLELERLGEAAAARLRTAGYKSDVHVYPGHPTAVIPEAMKSLHADLLIVGAHGHGFFEDLFTGSVALHQISHENYSVLVIRA